jgi:hypothetical protein
MQIKIDNFVPIIGLPLEKKGDTWRFKGGTVEANQPDKDPVPHMGLHLCRQLFSGGHISTKVQFTEVSAASGAEIVLSYDPQTGTTLSAGIPGNDFPLFAVREFSGGKWNYVAQTGDRKAALQSKIEYDLEVFLHGSIVSLRCDGVEVLRAVLSKQYQPSQPGLFIIDSNDVTIKNYVANLRQPKAFVICQFSSPYNEVYIEVIKDVCKAENVEVVRVDENVGPGLIIADVVRGITDATFVIADISPVNANVFYELGYAHGINKPAILIAEKSTKLPFDVSPFRTLFYENSISGKSKLEKGLKENIRAVLGTA